MTNKRDLKAYVRYDGSGRVIAGSLVLRRKKPKVGNWQEVQGYECCNDITISTTITTVDMTGVAIKLLCNDIEIGTYPTNQNTTSIEEVVELLNLVFGMIGTFTGSETTVNLTMPIAQKEIFCPEGTLTMEIFEY